MATRADTTKLGTPSITLLHVAGGGRREASCQLRQMRRERNKITTCLWE